MPRIPAQLWIVLAAVVAAGAGYQTARMVSADRDPIVDTALPGGTRVDQLLGSPAPDFAMTDLNQQPTELSSLRGTPLLLNFWGTWCPPCRDEIPDLMIAQDQLRASGSTAQIIGIAVDEAEAALNFAIDYQINYPIVAPGYDDSVSLSIAYGNDRGTYPYSVFIDREGRIDRIIVGLLDVPEAARYLKSL